MWFYTGEDDRMQLQAGALGDETVEELMKTLFAEIEVPDLPDEAMPLYCSPGRKKILKKLPRFDEWGLCPQGRKGGARIPCTPSPHLGPWRSRRGPRAPPREGQERSGATDGRACR